MRGRFEGLAARPTPALHPDDATPLLGVALVVILLVASTVIVLRTADGADGVTADVPSSQLPDGLPPLSGPEAPATPPAPPTAPGQPQRALFGSYPELAASWNAELDRLLAAIAATGAPAAGAPLGPADAAALRLSPTDFEGDGLFFRSASATHGAGLEVRIDGGAVTQVTAVAEAVDGDPRLGAGMPVTHLLLHTAMAVHEERDVVRVAGDLGVGTHLGPAAAEVIGFGHVFSYSSDGVESRLQVTVDDGERLVSIPRTGALEEPGTGQPLTYAGFRGRWVAQVEQVAAQLDPDLRAPLRTAFSLPESVPPWPLVEIVVNDGALVLLVVDDTVWEVAAITATQQQDAGDGVIVNALLAAALAPDGGGDAAQQVSAALASGAPLGPLPAGPNVVSVQPGVRGGDAVRFQHLE